MGEPSSPRWHVQYATFAFRIAFDFTLDCFLVVVVDLIVVVLGTIFKFSFAVYGSATTICCCCCCLMGEIVAVESCLPLTEEGFEVGLDDAA